jgi:uncharacterized protein (DUF1015 family)
METPPYAPVVYAQAAENLRQMVSAGVLKRDARPSYYAYRLIMGNHVQTGLVVAASVAAYDVGRIRRHELTQPDKVNDRMHQIKALNAQTGPVLLTHPADPQVEDILATISIATPETDVTVDDGVRHTIWTIDDVDSIAQLTCAFDGMPALYIADGHHRTAAASRVAAMNRSINPKQAGEAACDYFLAVAFPEYQMKILPYNRVIRDLAGMTPSQFLQRVGQHFNVLPSAEPVVPGLHGEIGLYMPGQWYRLTINPALVPQQLLERLDVSLLADQLLSPVLGIHDQRTDKRIDFVGGIRNLVELIRRVDSGEMAAAFTLHATSMQDLMMIANAGQIMPPKSTWFEPKLVDGLVSHMLD